VPRYRYEAVDAAGEVLRDELEAASAEVAVEQLRDRGLLPLFVNEAKGGLLRGGLGQPLFSKRRALSRKTVGLFTQQLASLLGAGMPLDRALTVLIGVAEDERSKALLERVQEKVRGGSTLADALEAQGAFSRFYLNMIRAGEAGGALETCAEAAQRISGAVASLAGNGDLGADLSDHPADGVGAVGHHPADLRGAAVPAAVRRRRQGACRWRRRS
jgi:type II secretory pathway component PulF